MIVSHMLNFHVLLINILFRGVVLSIDELFYIKIRLPMTLSISNLIERLFLTGYAQSKGYKFAIANNTDQCAQVFDLISKISGTDKRLLELDDYNQYSTVFVAYHNGKIIATTRLITVAKSSPTLDAFRFNFPNGTDVFTASDLDRIYFDDDHKNNKAILISGLIDCAYKFSIKTGVTTWFGTANERLVSSFQKINNSCELLTQKQPLLKHDNARSEMSWHFSNNKLFQIFLFKLKEVKSLGNIKVMIANQNKDRIDDALNTSLRVG